MCHPANTDWYNTTVNHFVYNPYTQSNGHSQNCFVVQNEFANQDVIEKNKMKMIYDLWFSHKQLEAAFGSHNFNMMGRSSDPDTDDLEKE